MEKVEMKTDEKLLERLRESAKRGPTKEEAERQRISFIFAGMPKESKITKVQISEALKGTS